MQTHLWRESCLSNITTPVEKEKPVFSTASGLMAKPVTCTLCKGQHTPKQCTVPMSVEDRFKKLREARACFRCGRSGHRMSACRFRKPCQCGRGSHIPQLCKTGGVKVQDTQRQPTVTPPSNTPSHPSWNPVAPMYPQPVPRVKCHLRPDLHKRQ